MGAKRIEYHQGASADVKSAVAWYVERSPKAALDFLEELNRASDVIHRAPERWPGGKERHKTLRALAISVHCNLLRARIRDYDLGRGSC